MTPTDEKTERLAAEDVFAFFSPDGPISQSFQNYELREAQTLMLANVLEAFNNDQIALIEAGTGTGKSLAYLVPAILWSHATNERIVISTNTIPLQEQLLHKDIPALIKALNVPVKAVLMKGMGNFLCLRKLRESLEELSLFPLQEIDEIQRIDAWSNAPGCNGDKASMPFPSTPAAWEKVGAESDLCNRNSCKYYQQCFYFQMRKGTQDAKIIIVNHHLLFIDMLLKSKSEDGQGVLPSYSRLILDEAHNIEDIATEYFAKKISQMEIMRLLSRLTSEKGGKEHGKLVVLKKKLQEEFPADTHSQKVQSLFMKLNTEIPAFRQEVLTYTRQTFDALFEYSQELSNKGQREDSAQPEQRLRLHPEHYQARSWTQGVQPAIMALSGALSQFAQGLWGLVADMKKLHPEFVDTISSLLFEIQGLSTRIEALAEETKSFIDAPPALLSVRWIELQTLKSMINAAMVDAKLDIADLLAELLFSKVPTTILCSATLTTNRKFSFMRDRLGLRQEQHKNRSIKEYMYDSPFDYQKQMLLAVPNDLPLPNEPAFAGKAAEAICKIVEASHGNAFVLFTSYAMMTECFEAVQKYMTQHKFHLMKQGDADRQQLLRKFVSADRSVLFGTDSFWEGIDIGGEALRCVILVKLPFKAPNDPIIEGRSEAITKQGGDPFSSYSLPQAIVKFKQGFGRLIRQKSDRGCVICLDQRLMTKRYGAQFLHSLPACQRVFDTQDAIVTHMKNLYKATHYLVKKNSHT